MYKPDNIVKIPKIFLNMFTSKFIFIYEEKKLAIVKINAIYNPALKSPSPFLLKFIAANNPIGGSNIYNDVAILSFIDGKILKKVNNGTIIISAPAPINPANIPLTNPVIVNPNKLFIIYI